LFFDPVVDLSLDAAIVADPASLLQSLNFGFDYRYLSWCQHSVPHTGRSIRKAGCGINNTVWMFTMYWKYCMAGNMRAVAFSLIVPSRRLEDRIRQLCADAVAAPASDLEPVITELKAALHEHTERLRKLAASKLALNIPLEEPYVAISPMSVVCPRCHAQPGLNCEAPVRGGLAIVHVERIKLALARDVSAKNRIAHPQIPSKPSG
jgi:hypothetical protein